MESQLGKDFVDYEGTQHDFAHARRMFPPHTTATRYKRECEDAREFAVMKLGWDVS
jgi:hypothetical protein